MEFSHHPGTDDFSAVFSKLHSQGASDTFDVFRSKRPMSCPGVTAEVYPGATHLSTTACTSDAHALCAYDPAPLTTAALAQASIGKKTLGSGRAAGSLLHLAPRCLLLPPLLAELALRQHPCRTRSSATTRRGRVPQKPRPQTYEFFTMSLLTSGICQIGSCLRDLRSNWRLPS